MILTRLYLRNYRVYEEELELELPPGLIGVYGPNGAGKSYLVESIRWTLFGQARTNKEEVRSSGVGADCVTELDFLHEGHNYRVRRVISGALCQVRAYAEADGGLVAEGPTDVRRYLRSVLGMDDEAFRASVFAEQKQLAAFSSRRPAERRDLVLRLLGVTPLDTARDSARRAAKESRERLDQLRSLLPDIEALRAELVDFGQKVSLAELEVAAAESAQSAAQEIVVAVEERKSALDELRRSWEALVEEGRRRRKEREERASRVEEMEKERATLDAAEASIADLEAVAKRLPLLQERLSLLEAHAKAAGEVAAALVVRGVEPPQADTAALEAVELSLADASSRATQLGALWQAARGSEEAARKALQRASQLSGEADCPLCGQSLGEAFEAVQAHRLVELESAVEAARELEVQNEAAKVELAKARKQRESVFAAVESAIARRNAWEKSEALHLAALQRRQAALDDLAGREPTDTERSEVASQLAAAASAAGELERVRGRLERRSVLLAQLEPERSQLAGVEEALETLRRQVAELAYKPEEATQLAGELALALGGLEKARNLVGQRGQELAVVREQAIRLEGRLSQADEQRQGIEREEDVARHLGRAAELLVAFRNSVVASIGPRLAVQAAELFAELTDHEYDRLDVDPETYELHLSDQGSSWGMARFSGSETDLANLALRVAISEQVTFQSGGAVGLLVLDEIFGPLDDDRRMRMLMALDRLRSRFQQVVVVTHSEDIKERLPYAIEVTKLAGRRARAALL